MRIFETIYYASLDESIELAKIYGHYKSYEGSPLSKGLTQIDLWNQTITDKRHPWTELKLKLKKFGARNSLLTAPMPTASTASILGNTESFEPKTSNLYTRRVLAGEYIIINKYLQQALHWEQWCIRGSLYTSQCVQKSTRRMLHKTNLYQAQKCGVVWHAGQHMGRWYNH